MTLARRFYRLKIGLRKAALLLFLLALAWPGAGKGVATNLRVAFVPSNPPLQFVDIAGNPQGMHIDLLNAIASRENFQFTYIQAETSAQANQMLATGQADLVLGALESISRDREQLQSSGQLFTTTVSLIAPNTMLEDGQLNPNIRTMSAVYEYGTIRQNVIGALNIQHLYAESSQVDVLKSHQEMPGSLMLGVKESLLYQLHNTGLQNQYTILNNHVDTVSYTILTRKGDLLLRRQLEQALSSLRTSQEYEDIYSKWALNPEEIRSQRVIRQIILLAIVLLVVLVAYAVGTRRIRALLVRKVREQTQELSEVNTALSQKITETAGLLSLQQRLIEFSPSGMVLLDQDRKIRLMSTSGLKMAGLEKTPVGEHVTQVPLLKQLLECLDPALPKNPVEGLSWLAQLPPVSGEAGLGRSFRCNLHATSSLNEADGELMSFADVTTEEQRRLHAFEEEKAKALSRLVAGIAHEIKNPLTSISTFARLLENSQDDHQVQEQFAEFVPGEVNRINRLIESLINYAKPSHKKPQKVNLKEAILECLYFAQAASKDGVPIKTDLKDGLFAWVDRDQFKQVMINLVMNAMESCQRKYQDSGLAYPEDAVVVTAKAREGMAQVVVMDKGLGMSPDQLSRCTDPFYTTKASGTGLGLALSRSFVEDNGGSMHIESQEGMNTRFTIAFKRLEA